MNFRIQKTVLTDVGTRKRVNQDAVLLKTADCARFGRICFAAVCDGLGGLSSGEVASGLFIRRMETWFGAELRALIRRAQAERLDAPACLHHARLAWQSIFMEMNESIARYGRGQGIRLGTTAVLFLLIDRCYLVMHVGDSRLYITRSGRLDLLTHDHSLVQRQIDMGLLTPAEALLSDQKSVLLQCVGASGIVRPDYATGTIRQDTSVLLCTDGFWRRLRREELLEGMRTNIRQSEREMARTMQTLVQGVKRRGERDNISVIFLRLVAETPETAPLPLPAGAVLC